MSYEYWVDRDPRPKTHVCHLCAREIEAGKRCICIPSAPKKREEKPEVKP